MQKSTRNVAVGLTALGLVSAATTLFCPSAAQAQRPSSSSVSAYYVALGDSYAVGDQPNPKNPPSEAGATSGYTGYVAKKKRLTLVNFGCGRETTSMMLSYSGRCVYDPGLAQPGPSAAYGVGPGMTMGGETQLQNAVSFVDAHLGHIGLITVSAGMSDVATCAGDSDPTSCLTGVSNAMEANLMTIGGELRAAVGPSVPIIGLGYPDAFIGDWVYPTGAPNQNLASEWVSAFQDIVNPALSAAYAATGANTAFVDVSAATDAYKSLTQTTTLKPYGTIPQAVAEICKVTYYCTSGNYRANTKGYELIGGLVVKEYDSLKP